MPDGRYGGLNLKKQNDFVWLDNFPIKSKETNLSIVFLHGFPDTAASFVPQIKYFEEFPCFAPSFPGTDHRSEGRVDGAMLSDKYSMSSLVLTYFQWIEKNVQTEKVILVAHDLGGPLAFELACALKERAQGLCLINTLPLGTFVRRWKNPYQWHKSWYILPFQFSHLSKKVLSFRPKWTLKKLYDYGELGANDVLRRSGPNCFNSIFAYQEYLKAIPIYKNVEKIKTPTLIIWGEKDRFLEVPKKDECEPFFTNFSIRVLNEGHWLHRDNVNRANGLIDNWIKELNE